MHACWNSNAYVVDVLAWSVYVTEQKKGNVRIVNVPPEVAIKY